MGWGPFGWWVAPGRGAVGTRFKKQSYFNTERLHTRYALARAKVYDLQVANYKVYDLKVMNFKVYDLGMLNCRVYELKVV